VESGPCFDWNQKKGEKRESRCGRFFHWRQAVARQDCWEKKSGEKTRGGSLVLLDQEKAPGSGEEFGMQFSRGDLDAALAARVRGGKKK